MADDALVPLPEKRDEVRLFLLYTFFGGDCRRVAAVSRVAESEIVSLAHDHNWKGKISGRERLDTEEGQQHERVSNRVVNYVVAERLTRVFSRLIDELDSDPTFARAFCTSVDEEGETSFSTKNLVELSKGLEIVANIKYRALGDKQAQTADVSGKETAAAFSLSVYKALATRFDVSPVINTPLEFAKALADPKPDEADEAAESTP